MVQFPKHFTQDLTQDLKIRYCGTLVFNADNLSNVVSVDLYNGATPATPSGTVVGAVICSDGSTVPIDNGTISGNTVSITLTQACFAIPGQIGVGIQLVDNGVKTTVLKAIYNAERFETDDVIDPDSRITMSVSDLIDDIAAAIATIPADYSDLMAAVAPTFDTSTAYAAGAYVWYDGDLYRFTADHAAGSWTGTDATAAVLSNDLAASAAMLDAALIKRSGTVNVEGGYTELGDGADDLPLRSCVVQITAKQAGSGTPSSENIRAISGFTGLDFTQLGPDLKPYTKPENLTGMKFTKGYTEIAATESGENSVLIVIPILPNTNYDFVKRRGYNLIYAFGDTATPAVGTAIYSADSVASAISYVYDVPSGDHKFMYLGATRSSYMTLIYAGLHIWLHSWGMGELVPEGVAENEIPIDWQSVAGTVYGGSLDMLTGVLTVTHGYIASYNGESVGTNWICDRAVYNATSQPTPPTGSQVVYALSSAQTYALEPHEIRTRLYGNVFMSDTGAVDVEYYADTKKYIDDKFVSLQALILENT